MIGPFDHPGCTPEDQPGFVHEEDMDDADLSVRLRRAHLRANQKLKRVSGDEKGALLLDIRKLEMCVQQIERVEATLEEIAGRL